MKSIELFAGCGGLAIGLEKSGIKPDAIIEFNKHACNTIRKNYAGKSSTPLLFEGDIRNFDYGNIEQIRDINIISGGPPCQPFSLGGKHKGNSDNRDMFPEAVRAIREANPKAFIFENVKGLLRKSFSNYFEYIILQLQYPSLEKNNNEAWEDHLVRLEKHHTSSNQQSLEYNVVYKLVNAANYGVPQKRERIFIVGFRSDINAKWSFPEETHSEDALLWSKWVDGEYWKKHNITPTLKERDEKASRKIHEKYGFIAPEKKPWVTVRDALYDLDDPRKKNDMLSNHDFKDGAKIYPGHTGSYIDEPSKAVKAGAHGVPGGENMIRFEDGSVRYFTVRESARIQTFPDDYIFEGSWTEATRQLGNAVPVKLAEVIGKSVKSALEN
ncbi:DNA cytosine methyltransferase [Salinivibrio kushneri]|uniref:DNA cytosine methyltransferase n=1 Tax=Salinivibrio kushneri TaxID=1908198 RepID=UPI00098931D4|nr:DNA cytosine methyltransferase [Salinivibrio kushneri]OOE64079.1 DNA (cytosine-5-)-methyltransferase [Salinivibrio kushneri]